MINVAVVLFISHCHKYLLHCSLSKDWCPAAIKSSDWRKKTRELMAKK
jgi:hypothetical protein